MKKLQSLLTKGVVKSYQGAQRPWMQDVMQFNPMYHYVSFFRAVMTGNFWQTNMDIAEVGICLGMAVVTFVIGFWAFRKHERNFILHI